MYYQNIVIESPCLSLMLIVGSQLLSIRGSHANGHENIFENRLHRVMVPPPSFFTTFAMPDILVWDLAIYISSHYSIIPRLLA